MLGKTHLLGGLAAGAAVAGFVVDPMEQMLVVATASAAGLLPDIDHSGSTAGRKFPILSIVLHAFVGHRTLTHSFLAVGLLAALCLLLLPFVYAAAVILGYASHLLLDYISYARYETATGRMVKSQGGIPLMYPSKKRYALRVIEIGSLSELVAMRLLLVGLTVTLFALSTFAGRLF